MIVHRLLDGSIADHTDQLNEARRYRSSGLQAGTIESNSLFVIPRVAQPLRSSLSDLS